jgi:hypothetical protein
LIKTLTTILRKDLSSAECESFHLRYLDQLSPDTELLKGFIQSKDAVHSFFAQIPEEKHNYKYAENKWTIKEVLQHIIDTERVFMYRCLRLARQDATPIEGFEQDDFITPSHAQDKEYKDLLWEFLITRDYSISLLESFRNEDLTFIGTASGYPISGRAVAFLVLGHEIWHLNIINERYL